MISTQEDWRQLGTGAWLRGADERLLLETKPLHTHKKGGKRAKKCQGNPDIHESKRKKRFEHIELPAELLDYFLRINKKNINQSLISVIVDLLSVNTKIMAIDLFVANHSAIFPFLGGAGQPSNLSLLGKHHRSPDQGVRIGLKSCKKERRADTSGLGSLLKFAVGQTTTKNFMGVRRRWL